MRYAAAPDRRGFSLVEMLITMLIMSLVLVIVTGGSTVAVRLFRNTMAKADAQMMLTQIERYLRDDLSFADECRVDQTRSEYGEEGGLLQGYVTQYHKNGYWYTLKRGTNKSSQPYQNILYKTFSATVSVDGEMQESEEIYEPLSASKSDRLEDLSVLVPEITYFPDENCFHVSNLRIQLDGSDIAGPTSGGAAPDLIVRALNQVRLEADESTT